MTSIKDIAQVVGCSISTVSPVINDRALKAACSQGFNVVPVNSHDNFDLEETLIKSLKRRMPIVVIDRAFEHENVSSIVLNNFRGSRRKPWGC